MPKYAYFKSSVVGKTQNLPDFKTNALLPVYEAVVNSINAIEERGNLATGEIIVDIIREKGLIPAEKQERREEPIKAFIIQDNGIGFNEDNFESFLTAESIYKSDKGGKGIGRFFWLKAFKGVEIESTYAFNGIKKKRHFDFFKNKDNKITFNDDNDSTSKDEIGTIVRLNEFKDDYRKRVTAYKTGDKIAQRIFEYILSYYICKSAPKIIVKDGDHPIDLNKYYQQIETFDEEIFIDKIKFTITHIKIPSTYREMHNIVLCANNRDVETESLQKYLGTSYQFADGERKFYYAAYVTSDYLDKNVDSSRLFFDLPQESTLEAYFDSVFIDKPLSIERIKREVVKRSKDYLATYLVDIIAKKHDLITEFINKNPSLRAVPKYCPEVYDEIQINSTDEKINDVLYYYKGKAELSIKKEHDKLLEGRLSHITEIKEEVKDLTNKIEAFTKDSLVGYILYRKKIIDLLESNLERDENGDFKYEKIIHDIVFPMKTQSDEIDVENLNLWLIDELLISHQFATSDIELNKISTSKSAMRPDIFICCEKEPDNSARSISIIEFKRPGSEAIECPIDQLFNVMDNFKDKKEIELTRAGRNIGRKIHIGKNTRYYCYAICDINDDIRNKVTRYKFSELKDSLGYSVYNEEYKAYIQVLAFDKILADVKTRHSIFFNTLKISN